jgi:wyosine [tRNA(Phe)-imidazoG37] synthetase (radical SAM superfamily)
VRTCIGKIDLPMFKLDAGSLAIFKRINRPAPHVDFEHITNLLCSLEHPYIQTALVKGTPSNTDDKELERYFSAIARIKPQEVHIYSIDRPVLDPKIGRVPPEKLEAVAYQGQKQTGIKIRAFYVR